MKLPRKLSKVKSAHDAAPKNSAIKKTIKGSGIKKKSASLMKKKLIQDSVIPGLLPKKSNLVASANTAVTTENLCLSRHSQGKSIKKKKSKKPQNESSANTGPGEVVLKHSNEVAIERAFAEADNNCSLNSKLLEGVCSGTLQLLRNSQEAEEKKDLFGSQPLLITLQISVHKVPQTPYRNIRCLVPNSTTLAEPDICLIVPDLQRGRKRDATFAKYVEQYEEKLLENGTKGIKQIIPFTQLRCEYSQFEMKRRLAHTFDLFLCDGRIQGHCYHFLGKVFEKAKKIPVPIQAMTKVDGKLKFSSNLQNEVDKAVRKVCLTLHSHGTSYSIPVGHSEFTKNELADNVLAVWKVLEKELPGGVKNIRAAYLKGPRTPAVPLYASLEPPRDVPVVKPKQTGEPVEDELSTLPGCRVAVFPSGEVKIMNHRTPEDLEFAKLNPPLDFKKGAKRKKNSKSGKSTKHLKVEEIPSKALEIKKAGGSDEDVSNEEDGDFENVEDAEAAYLSQWSESASLRELEDESNKEKHLPKKKGKSKRGRQTPGMDAKPAGKKGVSRTPEALQKGKKAKQKAGNPVGKSKSKKKP